MRHDAYGTIDFKQISAEEFALSKTFDFKGVRQVGKTWILKNLVSAIMKIQHILTLMKTRNIGSFSRLQNVDRILQNLMLASGQKIQPEKTLIIFDEVQDCPKVINSMKYFCENASISCCLCWFFVGIALAKPSSFQWEK
ncbi:MAG: AAA family ATPase [Frisingicoccus sp.]